MECMKFGIYIEDKLQKDKEASCMAEAQCFQKPAFSIENDFPAIQ